MCKSNFAWYSATLMREIDRWRQSKVLVFYTLIAPVLIFLLVGWMFSAATIRDLDISVVDMDHSLLSRQISRMIDATPVVNVSSKPESVYEARQLLEKGKTEAIVVIPSDTEKSILRGQSAPLSLYLNNVNLVKSGVIKTGVYKALATISGGIRWTVYQKTGKTDYQALQMAQPIKIESHAMYNPFGNYGYFLGLGLLPVMLTVFVFMGTTYAIGIELKEATARQWTSVAGGNPFIAISAKLAWYLILFLLQALVMNVTMFKSIGAPFNGSWLVLIVSEALLIIAYQSMALLVLWATSNMRLALSLGSAYTMMALSFSGLTFPTMAMPVVAKIFSFVFPFTSWLKIFLEESLRNTNPHTVAVGLLSLIIYPVIGLFVRYFYKSRLLLPQYWSRK